MARAHHSPEPAPVELWLVSPVHLPYVVPLDVSNGIDRHVAGKGHSQIITKTQQFTTLQETDIPAFFRFVELRNGNSCNASIAATAAHSYLAAKQNSRIKQHMGDNATWMLPR